ncbi:MAG: hypothetical protein WCK54_10790 [Desulfuromonadales bacterium]
MAILGESDKEFYAIADNELLLDRQISMHCEIGASADRYPIAHE